MFAIILFWTPPHFWMLAMYYKDDYEKADLPMMPVVKGDVATLKQIIIYTIILFVLSISLIAFGSGWIYLTIAISTGSVFLWKVFKAMRIQTRNYFRSVFGYSIIYLLALFTGIIVDSLILSGR
jgi:protoheme IX farnesyltransferase